MENGLKEAVVVRLDGQQIKARKMRFGYNPELEEARSFLARMVDYLKEKERIALAENDGDMQAVKFPPRGSDLDTALGIFSEVLRELDGVEFLLKEPSFNEHLKSLDSFNWKFFHEHTFPYIFHKKLKFDDE